MDVHIKKKTWLKYSKRICDTEVEKLVFGQN